MNTQRDDRNKHARLSHMRVTARTLETINEPNQGKKGREGKRSDGFVRQFGCLSGCIPASTRGPRQESGECLLWDRDDPNSPCLGRKSRRLYLLHMDARLHQGGKECVCVCVCWALNNGRAVWKVKHLIPERTFREHLLLTGNVSMNRGFDLLTVIPGSV